MKNFTHLHLHDQYSVLDGLGKAKDYCERAKSLGMTSIALTNHGNVDGCIRWQAACKEAGIKPIFGCEAYIVKDLRLRPKGKEREKRNHVTIIAKNKNGWSNLLKMLSIANIEGFYYRPRIDYELLEQYCGDLLIGSACASSFVIAPDDLGLQFLRRLKKKSADVYLEVMPIDLEEQRSLNKKILYIAEQFQYPIVATNDCHYVYKEDKFAHEVLLAMQSKKTWNDPTRWKFTIDTLFLQSRAEMEESLRLYSSVPNQFWERILDNSNIIADRCRLSLDPIEVRLPDVDIAEYTGLPPDEQLMNLVFDGLREKEYKYDWIRPDRDKYEERIIEELSVINGLGFSSYFLIVYELINWCKRENIMTGPGRGSVGGSLVAFCLGITKVDPFKYDLVFSRFISEARIDLPDIDMDFEQRYRKRVIQHLKDMYGQYNVIGISNFLKMKGKSAIRKVARVFGLPKLDVDKACDSVITRSGGDMRADFSIVDAFETFEDGRRFKEKYPVQADLAIKFEGLIMSHGRHAAGICVSNEDLRSGHLMNYANRAGTLVSNWDKKDGEHNGLMKLDILGLVSLDVLHLSKDLIKERKGVEIDYDTIPLDDKKVLSEFNSGNCVGVFQFNGNSIMRFCREIGIEDFEGVVAINALHRPGTLKSGTIHDYKDRKHGVQQFSYPHPLVEEITRNTYGIIIYQEQVMMLMYKCGGLPWQTTDTIRKAVSKSQGEQALLKFKDAFVDGCLNKGTLSREEAENIFETIKTFGAYGFNKSHAVEYSMIAFWQMWLKVYYPTEYMCAILSIGSEQKKAEHIQEARRLGLKLHLPDINKSEGEEWVPAEDGDLIIPLVEIKGVGPKAIQEIITARRRGGPFKSIEDLANRVEKRVVNSKVRKLLETCFCFSDKDTCNFDEAELDNLSQYFNFSLSNDPMYKYRKILKLIKKYVTINNISKCKGGGDLVWGIADKITYQIKVSSEEGISYSGCYGQMKDETGNYIMINFDRELYKERKDEIEHAEGQWMIVRVANKKHDSIMVNQIWFADDLLQAKFSDLVDWNGSEKRQVKLIEYNTLTNDIMQIGSGVNHIELINCERCELRQYAKAPVYPDHGRHNAMIIGEAPGREENNSGLGFVGASGSILWRGDRNRGCIGLSEYGISREDIWVSNFAKCYPGAIKTPKIKHLKACEIWWKMEVNMVKPFVILSFGNTGMAAIKGEGKGIMDMSGRVEWNDDLNCFIVYCLHPSAVLYHSDNAEIYNRGILSFLDVYLNAGFGT